jgi:hypothetical protein
MAKPTTNIPPRSKSSAAARPGARPAPPRPPRKPPAKRRRSGRSPGRFYGLLVGAVIAVAAIVVIVFITSSGGSSSTVNTKQVAVNFTTATGVKVYGTIGPEGAPLVLGTPPGSPGRRLTGSSATAPSS